MDTCREMRERIVRRFGPLSLLLLSSFQVARDPMCMNVDILGMIKDFALLTGGSCLPMLIPFFFFFF